MKKHITLILAASTLLLAGCCTTHQAKHWEYMQVDGLQSDASLNKLADEGWSVVAMSATGDQAHYVLKRAKQ
jgi:protein involved in sex pheromone biosynthesis